MLISRISITSLSPNSQGKIQVPCPLLPNSDYALVRGRIVETFAPTPQVFGSNDLACRFAGAGRDPSGSFAFFDPPAQSPLTAGPYEVILEKA